MSRFLIILLCFSSFSCTEKTKEIKLDSNTLENNKSIITTREIAEARVIGELGQPIGECFKIEAVIADPDVHPKVTLGFYHLMVTHVKGKKLKEAVLMTFTKPYYATDNVKLARDVHQLHELIHGKKRGTIDQEEKKKLEKGYVGKKVTLIVYETAKFTGLARNMPESIPLMQDKDHHFATELVVLDQL